MNDQAEPPCVQLRQRAYRLLTDGHWHEPRAVAWAFQTLALPTPKDHAYERERSRIRFTPRELSLAHAVQGVL